MVGMDQNDSIQCAHPRLQLWHMQSWYCWCCTSRCVPVSCRQAQDAPHHGRYGSEGQLWLVLLVRYYSCCVPSCRLQARDARHRGRYGPEGQLRALSWQWHVQGLVCWYFSPRAVFLMWFRMLWLQWQKTVEVPQLLWVPQCLFDSGYTFCVSTRATFGIISVFLRVLVDWAPEDDSRPLWTFPCLRSWSRLWKFLSSWPARRRPRQWHVFYWFYW